MAYVHMEFSVTLKLVVGAPQVMVSCPWRMAPLGQGPAPPVTGTKNSLQFSVAVCMVPTRYWVPTL